MARDLADGIAVGVVGLLDATIPLVAALHPIEDALKRGAMNKPLALRDFQCRAEQIDSRRHARQQRLASEDAATLDGNADRLVIFSVRIYESPIGLLRRGATVHVEALQDLVTRQIRGQRSDPCHRTMMAPRPRLGCRNDTGADRVEREVPSDLQEITVSIDEKTLESTRKDVPHAPMSPIERLAINSIQLPESTGNVRLLGLEEQMVVIPHEAVGVTPKAPASHDRVEYFEEGFAIDVIQEDRLPSIASRKNVEKLSGKLKT